MDVLTGAEMREVDRRAVASGIASSTLMENAGAALAAALLEEPGGLRDRRVRILCGKGNNGGDGLVAARHLARRNVVAETVLLGDPADLREDARANHDRLSSLGGTIHVVRTDDDWGAIAARPVPDLVVDAMLGTGIRGGARGRIATAIETTLAQGSRVVAVDVPSGLDADRADVPGLALPAARTLTLCRPKVALVLGPAAELAGALRVLPIGIPDAIVRESGARLAWICGEWVAPLLPARARDTHKGTYGHLLVVAGSRDRSGAAVLAARAALRGGAGLVTVACPAAVQDRIAIGVPEAMTTPLASRTLPDVGATATAIGPGLGAGPQRLAAIDATLDRLEGPAVLDADALTALATSGRRAGARKILTPHPGEAGRLLGVSTADVQADRVHAARRIADTHGAVCVLKGHRTIVANPDGRLAVSTAGNPGMATAGTGDVLTGVVGALLAGGLPPYEAACAAVWLHARAGDAAAARRGEGGLVAGDLIDELPGVLARTAAMMNA